LQAASRTSPTSATSRSRPTSRVRPGGVYQRYGHQCVAEDDPEGSLNQTHAGWCVSRMRWYTAGPGQRASVTGSRRRPAGAQARHVALPAGKYRPTGVFVNGEQCERDTAVGGRQQLRSGCRRGDRPRRVRGGSGARTGLPSWGRATWAYDSSADPPPARPWPFGAPYPRQLSTPPTDSIKLSTSRAKRARRGKCERFQFADHEGHPLTAKASSAAVGRRFHVRAWARHCSDTMGGPMTKTFTRCGRTPERRPGTSWSRGSRRPRRQAARTHQLHRGQQPSQVVTSDS
jgi:hypothetical protein